MEKPINDQTGNNNQGTTNKSIATEKQLLGIFKVKKLAKRKITTNDRILVVSESTFSYYNIPDQKGATELFCKTLEKIYNSKKISSSNLKLEEEEKDFAILSKEFNDNFNYFKRKEEMAYDLSETLYDIDKKENPKEWRYCLGIRQKNSDGGRNKEPNIYSKINKTDKDKTSGESKDQLWIFNLFEANFLERYKKLLEEIRKKKLGNNLKEIALAKPQEVAKNPPKIVKKEEEIQKKEDKAKTKEENISENDPEIVQMMYYNEICYQYLLKQYYLASLYPSNNSQIRMKYEFALIQMNTKFKEICQTLVKRIVADLYAKPFSQSNPSSYYLFPIVFPYPTKLKKQEQAVFLYYIGGINFTLTWHQTLFKMRSEQKLEVEEVLLNGAWNNLNIEFKNRDFFQDLMIRLCKESPNKLDLPRHPISCIIDYCGFRILCEADIYVDDGGSAVMRRVDSMNQNQMNNDPNYHFYKDIANIISNEKAHNNFNNIVNSSSSSNNNNNPLISPNPKGDQVNTTAEILIPVSYQNRDLRQQFSKQLYNFQHVIRYHSKQFKEVDNLIFNNPDIINLIKDSDKKNSRDRDYNHNQMNVTGNDVLNETSFIYGRDNTNKDSSPVININSNTYETNLNDMRAGKDKLNDFFELSSNQNVNIHLKDFKESIKYIMDLKVLIEIKDKFFDVSNNSNKKQNLNNNFNENNIYQSSSTILSMPKRSIYFRPEFIVKYLKEIGMFKVSDRDSDSNEMFIRTLKKYLYLDENSQPHYKNILETYKHFKENHINYFINCLDTMHFKPYDSETLTETFHRYGVNMFYLGLVAELTGAPHIRELCLIEMMSRICKKMIFDMISFKIIRRANEDYYSGSNDHGKNIVEYDYQNNSSEPYLQFMPTAFFIRYWKDYLKKCHILGSDSFKCNYYEENNKGTTTYAKGLYRRFWHRCTSYADKDIKPIFQTKDEKAGGKANKENNEAVMLSEVKKEIVQFFNVFFDFETSNKNTCKILNIEYNNKTLWDTIFERVKSHYNIDNKEVFTYCDPLYISLPALFSSIQYHSGISANFTVVNNSKYSNKDLINKEFSEDMIEIKPRTKSYSYRNFSVNKDKFDTIRNDYSLECENNMYKKVLLRYFTEKFQKGVSTYTWTYLHYMNALRRMDGNNADVIVDWITKNDIDLKDKIKTELDFYDFFKNQFTSHSLKFESVNYLFLQIIESFANILREDSFVLQNTTNGNQSSKNIAVSIIPTDFNSAVDYISEFWFSKHPFLSILYILIARLNLKTTKVFDEKTENYFKLALSISKDSLGSNNIFVANLCEEIGFCYIKSKKFYDGTRHYIMAYKVFKEHKEEFFECYMKILKKITKYFIILGYYKDALEYGTELVVNYMQYIKKAQTIDNFNFDAILYNLVLICKNLGEFEKGLEFCKKLLYDLQGGKPDSHFSIQKFKDWRHSKQNDSLKKNKKSNNNIIILNDNSEIDKFRTKSLFQVVKIYFKLIVKNLKDSERHIYVQALVKIMENKAEKEILKKMTTEIELLFENFFNSIKDEGEISKYFNKMLYTIGAKFEQDKGYQKINESAFSEIDRNFNEMWVKFRTLYKIFQNNKVFTSFIESDVYGSFR